MTKTRYDDYPEHPLAGVPQEVLDVARAVVEGASVWKDLSPSMVEPLADAVVLVLREAGYITWPGDDVQWPKHAFPPGDPGFIKDGGTLDFGPEHADHVVLPEATIQAEKQIRFAERYGHGPGPLGPVV